MEIKAVIQCPYCAVTDYYSLGYEEFGRNVTLCKNCEVNFAIEWEITKKEKVNEIVYTVKAKAGEIIWNE